MTQDHDDDYDVSSPLISDYLHRFGHEEPSVVVQSSITDSLPMPPKSEPIGSTSGRIYPLTFIEDINFVRDFLSKTDGIINRVDKIALLDGYLNISNTILTDSNVPTSNTIYQLININKRALLILVLIGVVFSPFINWVTLFVIEILFIGVIVTGIIVSRTLAKRLITTTFRYVAHSQQSLGDFMRYLKETEFVHLASQRRLVIEVGCGVVEDNANLAVRRYTFLRFRDRFYQLRETSLRLLSNNIHDETLFCTMREDELAPVLRLRDNDAELTRLSDHFSLTCIASLLKLNKLLTSEQLKLLLCQHMSLLLMQTDYVMMLLRVLQAVRCASLVSASCKRHNNELVDMLRVVKLVQEQEQVTKRPTVHQKQLSIHLRNALLNAYRFEDFGETDALKLISYDLENATSLLQRFTHKSTDECDIESSQPTNHNIQLDPVLSRDEVMNVCVEDVVIEDEIYEAEAFKEIRDIRDGVERCEDEETVRINRNLFYELKLALKDKKHEWKERERQVARRKNPLIVNNSLEDDDGHLLENDALRDKAQIRRRRRAAHENLDSNRNKYHANIVMKDVSCLNPFQSTSILAEFMQKRNTFKNSLEDNDDEAEVVFE